MEFQCSMDVVGSERRKMWCELFVNIFFLMGFGHCLMYLTQEQHTNKKFSAIERRAEDEARKEATERRKTHNTTQIHDEHTHTNKSGECNKLFKRRRKREKQRIQNCFHRNELEHLHFPYIRCVYGIRYDAYDSRWYFVYFFFWYACSFEYKNYHCMVEYLSMYCWPYSFSLFVLYGVINGGNFTPIC